MPPIESESTAVTIKPAKGRPMLQWVGKRPLTRLTAFPAQKVEVFGEAPESGGRLYHGDNKEVLAHLLANGYRGKVDLIYIDPPFDSGADYVRKVELRGPKGTAKIEGEGYTLGEQIQYTDIWANDNYLQFMYERLMLLRELLAETGSVYIHCDWHRQHLLRCIVDEVFGVSCFRGEISREKCNPKNYTSAGFGNVHDTILFYSKGDAPTWTRLFDARQEEETLEDFPKIDNQGRRYKTAPLHAPGVRSGITGQPWRGLRPPPGNHWRYRHATLDQLDADGLIEWSDTGNPRKKVFERDTAGLSVQDIWLGMKDGAGRYPTEKTEAVLHRILQASSNVGDLVLDCFIGSGTTAAVAQKLGRRWIGCDINKGAIQTSAKRLQAIMREQMEERARREAALELIKDENAPPEPAQYGFTVYRVNDYDLQIQHNEAVNLACDHIGVTRTKADGFFDGTLGKRLVKIVPFNHPLSPVDLEEVRKELEARPEEQREIVVVSLGKELAVEKWLDDWNRMRKRGDVPNKIEVIELRTDPKYGKFFAHRPASARVEIARRGDTISVEIKDFISPSITERLEDQSGLLSPKIEDWRAMVDCVMIDPAYDGAVFNVALSDIPEKKTDFVQGKYELPAPARTPATVAVKIIDMLGEEVLVTKDV